MEQNQQIQENQENQKKVIWYREPYVWMVIFFPALAVVLGFILLKLAIISYDGLVVDDYYVQGKQMNKKLDRDQASERHGLRALVTFHVGDGVVEVKLMRKPESGYELPSKLDIFYSHHTRPGFDSKFSFERMEENIYRGQLPSLIAGDWTMILSADDWRLLGTVRMPMPMSREFLMQPAYYRLG
jgi:uncharacterized protein